MPTFGNFRIIPLLVTSDVRVLRVTGFNPPGFTPGTGQFTGQALQDLPAGPPGWHTSSFDDSGWATPVIAQFDPAHPPISVVTGSSQSLPFDADPIWITPTPTDPDEVLLIRWWITPPIDAAFAFAQQLSSIESHIPNRIQFGFDDEPFGLGALGNLVLGARNLLTFAIPDSYRGRAGITLSTSPYRWVKIGVLFGSSVDPVTYCHIPMLVTDNVKMLRVTTPPTQPTHIAVSNGPPRLNPDSFGPAGWNLTSYDDTAWTTAVLVNPTQPTYWGVLHYPNIIDSTPIQGDPLWVTPTESDPTAVVLTRWRFDVPLVADPTTVQFGGLFFNTGVGAGATIAGYLNVANNADEDADFQGLGGDVISGAGGIGDIVPGAENLLCVVWGVYPSAPTGERFVLLDIMYQCSGALGAGNSTTRGWASNISGKLGVGDIVNRYEPTQLVFDGGFQDVVSAQNTSWGLVGGSVYAWGDNSTGSLGIGSSDALSHVTPEVIPSLTEVIQIAAGSSFNDDTAGARCFAVTLSGDLYGWGENDLAQLGTGDQNSRSAPVLVNTNVAKVSAGCRHSVVLNLNGTLEVVGDGSSGAFGLGSFLFLQNWTSTFVPSISRPIDVLAGSVCTWVLLADGTVWGCGSSQQGELGIEGGSMSWVQLPLTDVVLIGTAGRTLYAVLGDGSVRSLGSNARGGLGTGSMDPEVALVPLPVLLPSGVSLAQIVRSGRSEFPAAIALGTDGLPYTWGDGLSGQMGNATILEDNPTPLAETGLTGVAWVGGGSPSFFADTGPFTPPVTGQRRGHGYAQIVG